MEPFVPITSFAFSFSESFTRQVLWKLLTLVKFGETVSYQQLAALAGNPRAARAVGGAIRNNPVSVWPWGSAWPRSAGHRGTALRVRGSFDSGECQRQPGLLGKTGDVHVGASGRGPSSLGRLWNGPGQGHTHLRTLQGVGRAPRPHSSSASGSPHTTARGPGTSLVSLVCGAQQTRAPSPQDALSRPGCCHSEMASPDPGAVALGGSLQTWAPSPQDGLSLKL